MTPFAQRIAIAKVCGFTAPFHPGKPPLDGKALLASPPFAVDELRLVPDYLNDLNAIHDVEKRLDDSQYALFEIGLQDLVADSMPDAPLSIDGVPLYPIVIACKGYIRYSSATAAQRGEAFLRTLNLWDDTK